jgi:hypothetical protein
MVVERIVDPEISNLYASTQAEPGRIIIDLVPPSQE